MVGAAALSMVWATACTDSPQETSAYGSIGAAITATGSDGATYRLPPGSGLQVQAQAPANYFDFLQLDGDAATMSIDVPVGDYDVTLVGSMGPEWQLERTNPDMTTELVAATLITPLPVDVTVLEDQASNVVFQFMVSDGGTITFAQGSIQVSLDVSVQEAVNGRAAFAGVMTADYVNRAGFDPAFDAAFPATGAAADQTMEVVVTGNWAKRSGSVVCAPAAGYAVGSSYEAILDVMLETLQAGATVELCVTSGSSASYQLAASRHGAPSTSLFTGSPGDYSFYKTYYGFLGFQVFDGTTLDLGALAGTHTVDATSTEYGYADSGARYYEAGYTGQITFRFTPTP